MTTPTKNDISLIAMSGGVDSTVAALLTSTQAQFCAGAIMKLCSKDMSADIDSASEAAARIPMPFHVFDMQQEFHRLVVQPFVASYEKGSTPNPCVTCNRTIKFGLFADRAKGMGFNSIVTGHYARIERDGDRFLLRKAADLHKDQSYFLHVLTQSQLSMARFPLGEMTKEEVREIAEGKGFVSAKRRESQDICFVPKDDYASVIMENTGREYQPGDFVTPDGQVLGRHKGIIHYTIGQRRGLGLAVPESVYVQALDIENNRVIVGPEEGVFSRELNATGVNWVACPCPTNPMRLKARVRYRQQEQWAQVEATGPDTAKVVFDQPQRAITPGQSVVFYDGDYVVGGGVICFSEK